jgi:hypothetical protein
LKVGAALAPPNQGAAGSAATSGIECLVTGAIPKQNEQTSSSIEYSGVSQYK